MAIARDRLMSELLAVIARVPAGRVVTHATLAERWKVPPRMIAQVLADLSDAERDRIPWHRVVAPGGAIGRHPLRDEQMRRLRDEGVPVAPAGIVHELAERCVRDLGRPGPELAPRSHCAAPSRSRGMKAAVATPRKL